TGGLADQVAETIVFFGLLSRVDSCAAWPQSGRWSRLLKADFFLLAPLVDVPDAVVARTLDDLNIFIQHFQNDGRITASAFCDVLVELHLIGQELPRLIPNGVPDPGVGRHDNLLASDDWQDRVARDCWRRLLALIRRMNKSDRGHILQSQNEGRQLPARAVVARGARIPLRVKVKNDFGSRLFGLFQVPL